MYVAELVGLGARGRDERVVPWLQHGQLGLGRVDDYDAPYVPGHVRSGDVADLTRRMGDELCQAMSREPSNAQHALERVGGGPVIGSSGTLGYRG